LRFLNTNESRLLQILNAQNVKSVFIFGSKDKNFPPGTGSVFISGLNNAEVIVLNESHQMINQNFASKLSGLLL
jgi:hypothetical protein